MAVVVVSVGTSLLTNNIGRREVCGAERIIEQFERGKADMQGIEEIELKMEERVPGRFRCFNRLPV